MKSNTPARYSVISKVFHWGMATLVIAAIFLIEIKDFFPEGAWRNAVASLHMQAGLMVFGFIWFRLLWHITHAEPPITPPLSYIQHLAAQLAHYALYGLMIVTPLLGFLALQSKGKAITFLGYILPNLLNEDTWLHYALTLKDNHELLGNVFIWLIALHIASAVWHHVFRHDDTLKRMLP